MSCTVCSSTYRAMPRLTSRRAALIEVQESPCSMETTFTPGFDILAVLPSGGSVRVGPMGESEGAQDAPGRTRLLYQYALGLESEQSLDRKSTRLNSSHLGISYAVFCL